MLLRHYGRLGLTLALDIGFDRGLGLDLGRGLGFWSNEHALLWTIAWCLLDDRATWTYLSRLA